MIIPASRSACCSSSSVGLLVARKVDGDSTNFLVAGRSLALPLSAAGLMGQAVDSNATLGNTDLSCALRLLGRRDACRSGSASACCSPASSSPSA